MQQRREGRHYSRSKKTYAPAIKATIGEFSAANPGATTRAGVIEDNPDYADGEKFYWHDGDKVEVLFFSGGDLDAIPTVAIYTVKVAGGVKSKTCEFTSMDAVPDGSYSVYALYPAYRWSKEGENYKVAFPSGNYIMFSDASSTHLRDYDLYESRCGRNYRFGQRDDRPRL